MKILHISAECYPAAKAGGLGDVAGALPKYLNQAGADTAVIIPKYQTKWLEKQSYQEVYRGTIQLHHEHFVFAIEKVVNDELGFPLYVANIPGKFDRPGIYQDPSGFSYGDELQRALSFQIAVLHWLRWMDQKPEILHCHDHHTGLIPFLVKYAYDFHTLKNIPTVFTIHNGVYHGAFSWGNMGLLPAFDSYAGGLMDWGDTINPLASAIKCCWKLTTVSPSYMDELRNESNGLEWLLNNERGKSIGILNGIDTQVWNPKTDPLIDTKLGRSIAKYKEANKKVLLERFNNLQPDLPIFTFIGRLVREKGADLIPDFVSRFLYDGHRANFIILGTGTLGLHQIFSNMRSHFKGFFDASLEYNETLAHQLYAGSDFLIMPSRVEPCGLNQMYSMRYGTVPVVRSIGGLKDTVPDIGETEGRGIRFNQLSVDDGYMSLVRGVDLYNDKKAFNALLKRITKLDFSWEQSAEAYHAIYKELGLS